MKKADFEWRDSSAGPVMHIEINIPVRNVIASGNDHDFQIEQQGFNITGNIKITAGPGCEVILDMSCSPGSYQECDKCNKYPEKK